MTITIAAGQVYETPFGDITVVEVCHDKNGKRTGRYWCNRSWSHIRLLYTTRELLRLRRIV